MPAAPIVVIAVILTALTVTFIATSATYFPNQTTLVVAQTGTFSWFLAQPVYVSDPVAYTLYEFGNAWVLRLNPLPNPVTVLNSTFDNYVIGVSMFDPPINFPVTEYALSSNSIKNIDFPCLDSDMCRLTFGLTRFGLALGTTDTAGIPLSPPADALYAYLYPKSAVINQTFAMRGAWVLQF